MTETMTVNSNHLAGNEAAADAPPLEWLESQICELAGHLAAATCKFLQLIGDFDAREGWSSWDQASCAAWLSWKCQIAPGTAREHVRVARALRELPAITAEFAAGRMSYAKVRALTRIATPQTDAGLADLAGPMTAGQLDRFVAAHRKVSHVDDEPEKDQRRLTYRTDDDGSVAMSIRLPATDAAVLLQALRAATGDLEHPHHKSAGDVPAGTPGTGAKNEKKDPASLADALVEVAGAFLAGKIAAADNPDIYQVIVHVGTDALAVPASTESASTGPDVPAGTPVGHPADPSRCHLEDGPAISPAVAQRIACDAVISWMLHDHKGNLLDVGRRRRKPTAAIRRAVRERDRCRCQYPGCHSRRTDLHHIRHWARGGKTSLANMILLCEAHHMIVHELGYLITAAPGGGFTFSRPDGTVVPASPDLPGGDSDIAERHDADITPRTIVPAGLGQHLDLAQTIWACFANARIAQERLAG